MRALGPLVAMAALLAASGCGGGGGKAKTPTTGAGAGTGGTTPRVPGPALEETGPTRSSGWAAPGLPCGAVLVRTAAATRRLFTVATFRLVGRPGHRCDGTGAQARTAFGIAGGKIHAWVRLPDRRQGGGAPPPATTGPSV